MKKIALSVLMGMAGASMAADAVYSSNIVGFNKVTLNPGRNFVGISFMNSEGDGSYDIQDLLDTSNLMGGVNRNEADWIIFWNPDTQEYVKSWLFDSGGSQPDFDGKWMKWVIDPDAPLSEISTGAGDGFWYIRNADIAVDAVMSGNVIMDDVVDVVMVDDRNIFSSAYPVALDINDMDITGFKGGLNRNNADQLFVWDMENNSYEKFWLYDSGGENVAYDGKWICWASPNVADYTINVGEAVWVVKRSAGLIGQSKNF